MNRVLLFYVTAVWLLLSPSIHYGQAPNLGATSSFSLFTAAGAFNNLGVTAITGDIGTNVGAFSGFPPGVVIGQIHVADAVSAQAASDVVIAYSDLAGRICGSVLGTTMGNGQILTPNIYCTGAATTLNGNLVLDGQGNPNSIFIFQIDGAFATSTFASVTLINGAALCNVFWQVNGAFFLGDFSVFYGTVVASGAISLSTGATLYGRGLTTAGAIETSANVTSVYGCGSGVAPSVTCPPAVAVACNTQVPLPDTSSVMVLDACTSGYSRVFLGDVITNQLCVNHYTLTRTYQVTNVCGVASVCSQVITVNDQTAPVITCPANLSVSCASNVPTANPAGIVATDNCSGATTVTFNGDMVLGVVCPGQYSVIRTYAASDACGNSATCTQTITVNDQTAPVITCPANLSVSCANNVPTANPAGIVATDNCSGATTVTFNGDVNSNIICPGQFTVTRSYRAVDACGNSSTCAQTITVNDQTAPVITCPSNLSISCANNIPTANPAGVVATDNCGGATTVTFNGDVNSNVICPGRFTVTRSYRAVDACGNSVTCAQIITVNDQTAPVITCPANLTVACENNLPAPNTAGIVTSDNCGGPVTVVFSGDVISGLFCPGRYTVTRTYMATDACGNSGTCNQTITVGNQTPPAITCPANVTVACSGLVPAILPGTVVATGNCGGTLTTNWVSDIISNQICANQFTITRTYKAVDLCGNSALCAQTIQIFDNIAPVFPNPPANGMVSCGQIPIAATPLATDNCSNAVVTYLGELQTPGICPVLMNINRRWVASDLCGNTTEISQTLGVTDNEAPQFTNAGPFDVLLECDLNTDPNAYQAWLDNHGGATVTDCSDVTWTYAATPNQFNPVSCGNTAQEFIRFTATDACGNSNFRDAVFQIADLTPPVFTVLPQNITVECGESPNASGETLLWDWYKGFGYAEVHDACGPVTTGLVLLSEVTGCGYTYTLTYQFQATDQCGNTTFVSATFTLVDNTPPVIDTCPQNNVVLSCVAEIPPPDTLGFIAHDLCGSVSKTVISTTTGAGCAAWPLVREYQYIATDECGNSASCFQYFQVIDTFPIVYNGPDTITIACKNDLPGADEIIGLLTPLSSDNCLGFVCLGMAGVATDSNAVTFTMMAKDVCLNKTPPFVVTYIATGVCKPLCSAPQEIWGDATANINGQNTTAALGQFITNYGGVTAGLPGKSITATSTDCIQSLLPGAGTTAQLRHGNPVFSAANNCLPGSSLLNTDGTLKNKLVANVMALQFNIWYNKVYNDRNLGIQHLSGLPLCLVSSVVISKIEREVPSVQSLVTLANNYLAGVGYYPPGFGALLNDAIENLNHYWQNCQLNDPCTTAERSAQHLSGGLSDIQLSPNPVVDMVHLSFVSTKDTEVQVRFLGLTGLASQSTVQVVTGTNFIQLSTRNLPAGVYTIVLQQDNERESLRMVKVSL